MQRWVVLGVGGSKRTRGLEGAAAAAGVPVQLVKWRDWLAAPDRMTEALQAPCHFKVEPPGDDPQAHLALLHLGC